MKTKIIPALIALMILASLLSACREKTPGVAIESLLPDLTASLTEEPETEPRASEPADSDSEVGTETGAGVTETAEKKDVQTAEEDGTDAETEEDEGIPDSDGDFKFKRTEDGQTWLDSYSGKSATVVIPSENPEDGSLVTGIDVWAFRDSETVRKIVVPDSVKTIEKNAFMYCSALVEIELPDSLETLGDQAFYRCSALKKVSIPEGVKTLGYAAFMFCEALEEVTLPKTLEKIGDYAFAHCGALLTINYRGHDADWGKIGISEGAMPPTWYSVVYDYAG